MKQQQKMQDNRIILKRLRKDVLQSYKSFAKDLYLQYRDVGSDIVRIEMGKVILQHILDQSAARLKRKIYNKIKKVEETEAVNEEDIFKNVL